MVGKCSVLSKARQLDTGFLELSARAATLYPVSGTESPRVELNSQMEPPAQAEHQEEPDTRWAARFVVSGCGLEHPPFVPITEHVLVDFGASRSSPGTCTPVG